MTGALQEEECQEERPRKEEDEDEDAATGVAERKPNKEKERKREIESSGWFTFVTACGRLEVGLVLFFLPSGAGNLPGTRLLPRTPEVKAYP